MRTDGLSEKPFVRMVFVARFVIIFFVDVTDSVFLTSTGLRSAIVLSKRLYNF